MLSANLIITFRERYKERSLFGGILQQQTNLNKVRRKDSDRKDYKESNLEEQNFEEQC